MFFSLQQSFSSQLRGCLSFIVFVSQFLFDFRSIHIAVCRFLLFWHYRYILFDVSLCVAGRFLTRSNKPAVNGGQKEMERVKRKKKKMISFFVSFSYIYFWWFIKSITSWCGFFALSSISHCVPTSNCIWSAFVHKQTYNWDRTRFNENQPEKREREWEKSFIFFLLFRLSCIVIHRFI